MQLNEITQVTKSRKRRWSVVCLCVGVFAGCWAITTDTLEIIHHSCVLAGKMLEISMTFFSLHRILDFLFLMFTAILFGVKNWKISNNICRAARCGQRLSIERSFNNAAFHRVPADDGGRQISG